MHPQTARLAADDGLRGALGSIDAIATNGTIAGANYSYCVINLLSNSTPLWHCWRFSLVEAGCGSQDQRRRQRITVHDVCRDDHVGTWPCRSCRAISVVLRGTAAARRAQER